MLVSVPKLGLLCGINYHAPYQVGLEHRMNHERLQAVAITISKLKPKGSKVVRPPILLRVVGRSAAWADYRWSQVGPSMSMKSTWGY